jgi:hypothetical protein
MRKAIACLGVIALAGLASPAVAKAPKAHSFTATVQIVSISQSGSPGPPINGGDTFAGTVKSNRGNGAITGSTSYAAPNFKAKFTVWTGRGSYKGKLKGSGKLNPDGSASFTGTGKAKGGTGTFRHVTGSFTFTGSQPKDSNVSTFHAAGKLKY